MGGDSESNLEMRCSADEAWYDGSLSFAPDSKDFIVVHFNDFGKEEDERFPTSDLLDPKKLKSRVRVRSEQLQDCQCKLVNEGQLICGCLDDGEDRRYYDAKVVSIVKKKHSFSDEDGEECKCEFKLLWNDGPKKGKQTLVGCAEVCFLSMDNPEEDPMVKNLVKKLAGSGEQRRKLAAPKRLSTKDLPSPRPRAPSPTLDVAPSKKQISKEPSPPSLEHPPSKKQSSKEPPSSPEPASLKKQPSSKDHSPSTLPNHRVQLGQQASAKSQGSKKKRIMQAKIMEQPDLASDNDALNNLDVDARPTNTPKDRSREGSEDAPGHANESDDAERSGGGGESTKKGSVGRRRLVKAKASKAVVAPAPEVVLREEETPVRAIEKSISFREKVKLNSKKAATEDSAARDEATAIREEEDIRRPVKKRVKSNPKKPTTPEVTAPRDEAPAVVEDDDVMLRRPIKMRVKFNTSGKKANPNVAAAPTEAAVVREDDVPRSSFKEGEKSSTMKKATPNVPAVRDETVSLTLGERVKLKSLEKSKSVEASPPKKSEVTQKKKKLEVTSQKKPEITPPKKPEVSPQKKAEVTPPKKPEVTPQKKPEVTAQKKPEVTPQKKPEVTPQKKPEVTPQKKPEVSPQKKPEVTPQKKPEVTPQKKPEVTPQKKPEVSPQKKPEVSPQKKRKAAHKVSLEKVGMQIIGKQMQKQVQLEFRLRSKADEATRPDAPSRSNDVAAPAPKEQQKRKPGRPRKHPIPEPVSESLASKKQTVLGLSKGQRQSSQQEEIIDAAIVEKQTSNPANKKTTKSKRPREELLAAMPDAEDICSDKSTQEEDETRDEPQRITTQVHNDRKTRGTTERERQQPQNDDALSDKSTDDDEDHTPLVKKTKRPWQSPQIDCDKTTKSHTDDDGDHTPPSPHVVANSERLEKKSLADSINGIEKKYSSNRPQFREPNVEKTLEAQEAMTPGSSEELTGSPPRASNQVQETARISDLRKPETPATEVNASGKRRRRHVVLTDDEEDEDEAVAKKSKNGKEHLHGSVDSSANGQDDCNDPKTTSTSALDEEVVVQDGGKKATSRLLLISNMETSASAHDAMQLLQEHTEGVCAVHVLPVGELQSAAVGYALYRNNEFALKAFEHLTAPDRFVVSPDGRPWIISQSMDIYGPRLCGFAAHTAFKSDDPGMYGIVSDQPPVQELLMVTKEKDSQAYSQAVQRSKAYVEHQKWRKELHDRVLKDEMKG